MSGAEASKVVSDLTPAAGGAGIGASVCVTVQQGTWVSCASLAGCMAAPSMGMDISSIPAQHGLHGSAVPGVCAVQLTVAKTGGASIASASTTAAIWNRIFITLL